MRAISLFSGAGGFDLGAKRAGIEVVLAVEYDEQACDTFAANNPSIPLHRGDIREIDWGHRHRADVVFGGPPCQPFSCAANGSKGKNDPRDMVPEFLRCVREVRPAYFVMENVPSLSGARHAKYFARILSEMRGLGYAVSHGLLQAADFGICTKRRRLFVVGSLGLPVELPAGAVAPPSILSLLDDVAESGPAVIYAKNPVVKKNMYSSLLVNGRGKPIDMSRPCNTITGSWPNGRPIVDLDGIFAEYHASLRLGGPSRSGVVSGVRRVNFVEACRIQGFPSDYVWLGSNRSKWRQVGNAVPPGLGAAVLGSLPR